MSVVRGVQEESCAELTGAPQNPSLMACVPPTGYFLCPTCGPAEGRPETTCTPEMLRRTAQQREKREIIKGPHPLVLQIRVMPSEPSLQKELTAPTSPGHGLGALDLCLVLPRGLRFLLKYVPF